MDLFVKSEEKKTPVLEASETFSDEEILEEYRNSALLTHTRLRFGDPTVNVYDVNATSDIGSLKITDVYTPLSVATEFVSEDRIQIANKPGQKRQPVIDALSRPESHRALVLGDPGAGKSTLVDVLVCKNISADDGKLPIHVRLSELEPNKDYSFWHAIDEIQAVASGNDEKEALLLSRLKSSLDAGEAILLFDGIDEVAEKHALQVIQTIRVAAEIFSKCQIIATCRTADYFYMDSSLRLDFSKVQLLPFELSDMIDYIDLWYSVLDRLDFVSEADSRKRNLQDALRNSGELKQLGSTPLLLTLMALVHTTEGELPKSRALLYRKTVSHLLAETPQWRRRFGSSSLTLSDILPVVERIAFEIHEREVLDDKPVVGLTLQEIENIIVDHLSLEKAVGTAQYQRLKQRISLMLERITKSNGLFLETRRGYQGFSHRSLQEFLAGMYFLSQSSPDLVKRHAPSPHWREPLILMAGYGGREASALFFITKVIAELTELAVSGAEQHRQLAVLSGEMLAEIGAETLIARGQSWMLDGSDNEEDRPSVWNHVVEFLSDAANARGVGIKERITILRVLGRIGDERLVDSRGQIVPVLSRISFLPPTAIELGDDAEDRPKPKSHLVNTVPMRRWELPGFHAAKFLVTNVEYRQFLDDQGYEDQELWCTDGRRWLNGDRVFREELQNKTREWIERDFGPELKSGKYRMEDILRESNSMTLPRSEPFFWRNERYNQVNQPVVGVNLWEAKAFCAWTERAMKLAGQIAPDTRVRLPREREWERAARGTLNSSIYPWGNTRPTEEHAHTRGDGLDLDYATPVGCFVKGRTSHDLYDVAGNVWEWTISRAVSPDESEDEIRDDVEGIVDVVVRGGSWFSDEPDAIRCGYRGIDLPQNVYYDVGFRLFFFDLIQLSEGTENERLEGNERGRSPRSNRPV